MTRATTNLRSVPLTSFCLKHALLKTNSNHPERSEGSPILPQILRCDQNDYGLFWHAFNRAFEALSDFRGQFQFFAFQAQLGK